MVPGTNWAHPKLFFTLNFLLIQNKTSLGERGSLADFRCTSQISFMYTLKISSHVTYHLASCLVGWWGGSSNLRGANSNQTR